MRNANAIVSHPQHDRARHRLDLQNDVTAGIGELGSVVHQVRQNLLDARGLRLEGRQSLGDVDRDATEGPALQPR